MEYIVHAIILESRDFKDADRLYSVLSLEKGLLKIVAKSVKKNTSKLSGFLIPSNHLLLMLAQAKSSLYRLAQIKVLKTHEQIIKDYHVFLLFNQFLEVLLFIAKENLPDQQLYYLSLDFLNILDNENLSIQKKSLVHLVYLTELIKLNGFKPQEINLKSKELVNFLKFLFQNSYLKNKDLMLKLKIRKEDFLILKNWFKEYLQNILERELKSF